MLILVDKVEKMLNMVDLYKNSMVEKKCLQALEASGVSVFEKLQLAHLYNLETYKVQHLLSNNLYAI